VGQSWGEALVEPRLILVDGYNVIRNTPGLLAAERTSLAAGRDALIAQIAAKYRHTPHRVIVVFDGDGPGETVQSLGARARGQIIYTQRGVTADDVIQRIVRGEHTWGGAIVVTQDLDVQLGVEAAGAASARPHELAARLNAPPTDLAKRAQHRQAVRSQLDERDAYEPRSGPKKGNGKRAPRKRTPRQEATW
jgi:predicted RNA-binding protein with PIN domain